MFEWTQKDPRNTKYVRGWIPYWFHWKNFKCSGNSIQEIQETQASTHGSSTKELHSYCDTIFPSSPSPSMYLQDKTKGWGNQIRRPFHKTPLDIPVVDFHMPDIPIETFSTFFGNTSEDA